MAYEPKRPTKKTGPPSPAKSQKGKIVIASEQVSVPWYRETKHILLLSFLGGLLLLVIFYKLIMPTAPDEQQEIAAKREAAARPVVLPQKPVEAKKVPEIAEVKLSPASPVKGDSIKADVTTAGANTVKVAYQWSKNGEVLPEVSDTLSGDFNKGDKISLTVTPSDEKEKGMPVTVSTYILNSPPRITSTMKDSKFENGVFTYQVKAQDPDDDALAYSLLGWPNGMTIDSKTGLIRWQVPAEFKGAANVLVSVSDGAGGEARQRFNIQLNQEAK